MSALGQFGNALGQGYMRGTEYKNEQDRLRNDLLLKERAVAVQENEAADRNRQFQDQMDWNRIQDLTNRLYNPEWRRNARPGEIKKLETELAYHRGRRPEWFAPESDEPRIGVPPDSPARHQGATGATTIQTTPPPIEGSASLASEMRPQFLQQEAPTPPAATPQTPYDPSALPITDEQVSSLMRETDPNFNIAQNQRQAAMRPQAPAARPQVPAAAPPKRQATDAEMPPEKRAVLAEEQAAERYWAMSKDPQYSDVEKERFAELASNHSNRALSLRQGQQSIREGDIRMQYLEPGLQLGQAVQIEDILMKRFERNVGRPTELGIQKAQLEAKKIAAAMDAADKAADREKARAELNLKLAQYNLDVNQFDALLIQRAKENGYKEDELKLKMQEPDWRTKLYAETAAKHAYNTSPTSGRQTPGPTLGEFNRITSGGGRQGSGLDFNSFDHNGYLNDPSSSPQQKAMFYKSQGWPVPKALLALSAKSKKAPARKK